MDDGILDSPILLMCSERSGSNLLTKVFDAHPEVTAPGATHLFRIFSEMDYARARAPRELARDVLAMFDAKFGDWLLDERSPVEVEDLLARHRSAPAMIAALLNGERRAAGKQRVLVKEVALHRYLPFVLQAAARPRFVFMTRDPRDMALSWLQAPAMRGGVARAAGQWLSDQQGFLDMAERMAVDHPVAFLTYEELIGAPAEALPRVCAALGMDFHPNMLSFQRHSRGAAIEAGKAKMLENLAKPFLTDNSGKFQSGLDADQIAYVEAVCGPLMPRFGYAPQADVKWGSFPDFAALEAATRAREPWEKPQYQDLPAEERARYQRWTATRDRLRDEARERPRP